MREESPGDTRLTGAVKLLLVIIAIIAAIVLLREVASILAPFLWALLVAYLLSPIVNYFNVKGGLPRLWSVTLLYACVGLALVAASRYLYPPVVSDGTVFLEDIPRLEAALIGLVGPKPMGIDITSLVAQLSHTIGGYTSNNNSASHLLVNAFETIAKVFLFLVSTFYLLMDGPRIRRVVIGALPRAHREELHGLAHRIHVTWQQYIRGELTLFVLMTSATTISLTIFGVPGAIFLGLLSGALELLPLVGPLTAGTIAVGVAYFNGSNPWGWSQIAYAGAIAVLYLVLRNLEDYFVIPHVLGRAVRLHPLVILFSVAAGGVIDGLFGLIIAVPLAASLREVGSYVYAKLQDESVPWEQEPEPQPDNVPLESNSELPENGYHAQPDCEPAGVTTVQPVDTGA